MHCHADAIGTKQGYFLQLITDQRCLLACLLKSTLINMFARRTPSWLNCGLLQLRIFCCWVILQIVVSSGPASEVVQNSKATMDCGWLQVDARLRPMLATFFGRPQSKNPPTTITKCHANTAMWHPPVRHDVVH